MGRGPSIQMEELKQLIGLRAVNPLAPTTTIARKIGKSFNAVRRAEERYKDLIAAYRELKSRDIIEDLDCIRRANLMHVANPAVIRKQTGLQAATTYAILTDKMLLESGRPTSINLSATVDATMPDVLARLKRAIEVRAGATTSSVEGDVTPGQLAK